MGHEIQTGVACGPTGTITADKITLRGPRTFTLKRRRVRAPAAGREGIR